MGKYEEITKARQVLGLDESASLRDVKDKYSVRKKVALALSMCKALVFEKTACTEE